MLRKLMKYEFKATARTMLPMAGVTLLLSVLVSFIIRFGENVSNPIVSMLFSFLTLLSVLALCGMGIVVLVLMINRFRHNILSDEGYITLTLPVSIHKVIWSKIIVSSVWCIMSIAVVALSLLIMFYQISFLAGLGSFFGAMWDNMTASYALNGTAVIIELLVVCFFSYAAFCLMAYASMAIGYSFNRYKGAISVGAFLGLTFITNTISVLAVLPFDIDTVFNNLALNLGEMGLVHVMFIVGIVVSLIACAVYYFITTYMLKHKLNID